MIDQAIIEFDKALRTVFAPARSVRPVPGEDIPDAEMSEAERAHAASPPLSGPASRIMYPAPRTVCSNGLSKPLSILPRRRDTWTSITLVCGSK